MLPDRKPEQETTSNLTDRALTFLAPQVPPAPHNRDTRDLLCAGRQAPYRRPHEKHARAARLGSVKVVEECAQRIVINLHGARPAAPGDATAGVVHRDGPVRLPGAAVVARNDQLIGPF